MTSKQLRPASLQRRTHCAPEKSCASPSSRRGTALQGRGVTCSPGGIPKPCVWPKSRQLSRPAEGAAPSSMTSGEAAITRRTPPLLPDPRRRQHRPARLRSRPSAAPVPVVGDALQVCHVFLSLTMESWNGLGREGP